jgi:protein ImuB
VLWACIQFPEICLDALHPDADARAPHAVIDGPSNRRRIAFANAAARSFGVRRDQPVAAAQALCPSLTAWPRDRTAESARLESLADWACRFSTEIGVVAPDALYIEIGASLKLFGGWPALERRMRAELGSFGIACRLAVAPTAAAARVLASCADGTAIMAPATLMQALDALPLDASGLAAATLASLRGMGFRHLREIFRLPRAELARRIGEDALAHLDRLRGMAAENLARHLPRARFERRIDFDHGIENTTALQFPLQRLVREFAMFLAARDGGVQRFSLALGHERGARTCIDIGLLAPAREADSLFEFAKLRLERIALAAPVHSLILGADDLPPLCPLHRDLFDAGRGEILAWPVLAERLRARLGDEALRGIACVADHRPERAWRFVDPSPADVGNTHRGLRNPASAQATMAAAGARPFWLLPHPIPLRPAPQVLAGPERIESGWWDGCDGRRDYYLVKTRNGQRAWAFVPVGTTSGWMLHGWFA